MRSRSLLSSAAIFSSLLATTALHSPAWAQKAAMLAPVTQWAVTKVNAEEGGAGGYCAVARRFVKNTILTLARNENDEASIALDFQAPKLNAGENMQVTLDPGAGEQRSYDISPVSNKAFVVRMGRDDKFFAALQTTGYLRIEAAGADYSFNLADIDAGQSSLSGCLVSMTEPAAGESADAAPSGGGIRDEIAGMRQDIQGLKQENQRLTSLVSKSDNLQALGQPEAHDDVIVTELSSSANRLQGENEVLRAQAKPSSSGVSSGEGMIEDLHEQNKKLQNALFSMKLERGDVEGKQSKIAGIVRQNVSARSSLSDAPKPEGWQEDQAQAFALKEENERLQNLLAQHAGEEQVAQNLQEKVETLQTQNEMLQGDVQQTTETAGTAGGLQKTVDDLTAQLAEKDKKLVELTAMSTEAEALRAKNKELEDKLLNNSGDKTAVEGLNQKIKDLEEENNRLIGEIQNNTAGGGDADKIASLTKENKDLKDQIESMKHDSGDTDSLRAENDKLRKENADMKDKLAAANTENKSLKEKLAGLVKPIKDAVMGESAPKKEAGSEELLAAEQADTPQVPEQEITAQDITSVPEPKIENGAMDAPAYGMTEAQMQENHMRETMNDASAPQAAKPLEARKSEDPYAAISPPQENLKGYESAAGQPPQAKAETLPAKETPKDVDIAWNNTTGNAYYHPSFSVQDILAKASIAPASDVRLVEKVSNDHKVAWQWKKGEVYGFAEQAPMSDASQFDAGVKNYLTKTQKRCAGDFAVEPASSMQTGPSRIDSYEIACVGKGVNSSAALIFINKEGTFTVVAHEAPSEKMGDAMEIRDRLLKTISGS